MPTPDVICIGITFALLLAMYNVKFCVNLRKILQENIKDKSSLIIVECQRISTPKKHYGLDPMPNRCSLTSSVSIFAPNQLLNRNYKSVLEQSLEKIRPELRWDNIWFIHHDNTPTHLVTCQFASFVPKIR